MTTEQKLIAIAKACGWTDCEYVESIGLCKGKHPNVRAQFESGHTTIPDYTHDLNIMHEVEKLLTYQQHCHYVDILEMIVFGSAYMGPVYMPAVRATASQRADAFIKTLGLDTKKGA
jgi:hypothetical protein